ncbi:MAG: hypothetical protein AB1499_06465, partial [Nitrospirota bacterium]
MVIKLGDPNQECKDRVLKLLDRSAPPEISAAVVYYRASIANAASVHMIDKAIADRLCANAKSFRHQCLKAIVDFADTLSNETGSPEELMRRHNISDSGWHLAPYNPNPLITLFPSLRMRKRFHLGSYQYKDVDAFVFVMPRNRTLPKRPPDKALQSLYYGFSFHDSTSKDDAKGSSRGLPAWASQDIESYLEGDGSPLSYYHASIFLREVNEL